MRIEQIRKTGAYQVVAPCANSKKQTDSNGIVVGVDARASVTYAAPGAIEEVHK